LRLLGKVKKQVFLGHIYFLDSNSLAWPDPDQTTFNGFRAARRGESLGDRWLNEVAQVLGG